MHGQTLRRAPGCASETFRPKPARVESAGVASNPCHGWSCRRWRWSAKLHGPIASIPLGLASGQGWDWGREVTMTQFRRLDVEAVLHEAYPLFSFSCSREAGGSYSISLGSQLADMPRTTVVGIHGDELSSAGRVRSLGLELINCFIDQ